MMGMNLLRQVIGHGQYLLPMGMIIIYLLILVRICLSDAVACTHLDKRDLDRAGISGTLRCTMMRVKEGM